MAEAIVHPDEIFNAARRLEDPQARKAYLDHACAAAPELREKVEALLMAHEQTGAFLEGGIAGAGVGIGLDISLDPPVLFLPPGTVIGRYKLLEPIGEGGYGVVFMAEQTSPVQRKVALKIIKAGMDTRQVIARFEAERQALALMDHPNIAKVFDAGVTDTGRPYFVMELVKGVSIVKYCDQHHLPPRARLELFVQVCHAVQHAHTKGIIHRDLKPSNVLIALYDGKPVPKVIDFGVAKATGQKLTERTMFTSFGDVIGTLEYMSPEQAELNQLDVDTRSDIYSLGVLLYELLTGSTPLENKRIKQTALLEVLRFIREEEPPKPSTRLSTAEQLPSIAANRGLEPKKLSGLVKGELDWIVMKALEKDRNRRYDTANGLAADVERYLNDQPVEACPPSAVYRYRKLARRHKAVLATAAVIALAVVLAVSSLAVSYLRIDRSLQHEKQAREDLVQTLYYQWVGSALQERSKNRYAHAEELLEQCPIELRGWEWHYNKRLPFAGVLKLPHDDIINRVAWSPSGRMLASGSLKGWVKVWDAQTGAMLFQLEAQKRFVRGLTFSPDGQLLATGGEDDRIKVWDVGTHRLLREFKTPTTMVQAVEFSPDSRQLAAADQSAHVHLWNLASGAEVILSDDWLAIGGLAFISDGRRLITVSAKGVVKILDVTTRQTVDTFHVDTRATGRVVAFNRDRRLLAIGFDDGTIKVLRTDPFAELRRLEAHAGEVAGIAFGAQDQRLTSTGIDLTVKIWDLHTGQEAFALDVTRRANGVAFSPEGDRLAVGSADGFVQILDGSPLGGPGDAGQILTLEGHQHAVVALAYSPDGARIASASWDATARIWDAHTGLEAMTFRRHTSALTGVAWTPDGRRIASASWDGTARIWDPSTGAEVVPTLDARAGAVYGLAFNRDGTALATAHHDGSVRVWDGATGRERACIAHAHNLPVLGVAFSPGGDELASAGGGDNKVKVWKWNTDTRQPVRTLSTPGNIILNPAYSPDGKQLVAVVATPPRVWTWDAISGEGNFRSLPDPWKTCQALFAPGGGLMIVCGDRIQFLEPDGSDGPALVGCHAGEIGCAAFSPDGRHLATGAGFKGRGEIRIWETSRWKKSP